METACNGVDVLMTQPNTVLLVEHFFVRVLCVKKPKIEIIFEFRVYFYRNICPLSQPLLSVSIIVGPNINTKHIDSNFNRTSTNLTEAFHLQMLKYDMLHMLRLFLYH